MVETYFYSWAIIWFPLVTFHVKDYSWKWWSVLWMSVETGKKTSFNHQKPRMKKKLCFSRLLRLLCKLRVSDPDRPLACKDEEEWVFVVALYLFVRIFFMSFWKRVIYRGCAEITDLKPAWRWALLQPFVLAFRNF